MPDPRRDRDDATLVEPPLRVSAGDELEWHDDADVVVVGFGGAGAVTAIQAMECGAKVIVVDRFEGGGATILSGGVTYSGATDVHREAGLQDTIGDMFEYLKLEVQGVVSDETLRRYCRDSQADIDWLRRQGVVYKGQFQDGRMAFPPEDVFVYYTGNEKLPASVAKAKPAPRGLRAVGKGLGGQHLYAALKGSALRLGAKFYPHSPAVRLVMDSRGAVLGVEVLRLPGSTKAQAEHAKLKRRYDALLRFIGGKRAASAAARMVSIEREAGERQMLRARKAVVLSAGGFIFNAPMVASYAPRYAKSMPLGTVSCNGSGIQLGLSAGGAIGRMDKVAAWRHLSIPAAPQEFLKALLVNVKGERFLPEDAYAATIGSCIAEAQEGRAWLIFDRDLRNRALHASFKQFGFSLMLAISTLLTLLLQSTKRGTLEALADATGIDRDGLCKTVAAHNSALSTGGPDPFGKAAEYRKVVGRGPYYAVYVGTDSKFSPAVAITLGGLLVDERSGRVKRADGTLISGLYAAGRTAVGLASGSYVSGLSIGDCVFSGRRAGRYAADEGLSPGLETPAQAPLKRSSL